MSITINYNKKKNTLLFQKMQQHKGIQLSNIQNYIPIYTIFFALNQNNYNSVNLNHSWSIIDIKENAKNIESDNIFTCKLKNILDEDLITHQKVFFKMAPLLDPFKYIIGKYNHLDKNLFNLPILPDSSAIQNHIHSKIMDPNNSSYIDGFFAYLTSQLLNTKQFLHGIDYFGSFLSIKNNFKLNVMDDLDYLINSDFFNNNKNNLFKIEDYSHLIKDETLVALKPIKILMNDQENVNLNLTVESLDLLDLKNKENENENENENEIQYIELEDITNSAFMDLDDLRTTTIKSISTCSSRTSHTNENDVNSTESDNEEDSMNSENSVCGDEKKDEEEDEDEEGDEDEEEEEEEEKLLVTIPEFPVQVICMENCEETLDDLIINNDLKPEEWFSAFMQIIMTLITYQKLFSFTHNDLHTNNIMYVKTNIKYLYYVYNKQYYKVPTFGRIFKIIDFGRAIYKFNGHLFCSDSFQIGEDAATQYNTEPYFNSKKPRLEPNYSFDLCRLACSILDYVVDDFNNIKCLQLNDPVIKLIVEWCLDDNGLNVVYKNNGIERYPDFKLYKMIARNVHNHTPQIQLERPEFKKYLVLKATVPKDATIMNIDEWI